MDKSKTTATATTVTNMKSMFVWVSRGLFALEATLHYAVSTLPT